MVKDQAFMDEEPSFITSIKYLWKI